MITALVPIALAAPLPIPRAPTETAREQQRVLIVFAEGRSDPKLHRQRATLDPAAMRERDVHLIEVVGDTVSGAREYAGRLRQRFGISEHGFATLLLGRDGGVKLKSDAPVAMTALSATIDAMPMRRREMRATR